MQGKWLQATTNAGLQVNWAKLFSITTVYYFVYNKYVYICGWQQIGPGISVMTFNSRVFGRAKIVLGIVAVEPLIQRLVHHIYSPRWQPTLLAKFILYSLAIEVPSLLVVSNIQYNNSTSTTLSDMEIMVSVIGVRVVDRFMNTTTSEARGRPSCDPHPSQTETPRQLLAQWRFFLNRAKLGN